MNLNELAKEAHQISVDHGWWEKEPSFGDLVSLMHSELSEALEEYRAGRPMVWHGCMFPDPEAQRVCEMNDRCKENKETCKFRDRKPEGIAVELADCIIRILDWAGHENVNMDRIFFEAMEAYKDQPEEEQSFGEFISALHNLLSMAYCDSEDSGDRDIYMTLVVYYILESMGLEGVNMDKVVREKMAYNRTRPYRHGGKLL